MLSKSFKAGKCKTSLKLAASRIKLLKNKRDIQVKHLRRELAQLLATGQEQTARIRVEHVIREEKTMSAYDLIELYCELIVARLPIIESQKSCPIDLKEAISSVIFASPRCADIPELVDARKHFVAKYGKEFATSALELRPDCGVNRLIVEKLSAKAPDTETKIKILTAIAKEHDVKWDSKAFEELQKPTDDLLNGSSSFTHANKTPIESLNDNFSPAASQKEAASKILQSEMSNKPTSFSSTSHANLRASSSPVPPIRNESMASDRKATDSYSSHGTTSLNEQPWTMEFKDAVSAAQVAAISAERASMAARAAAELASRGNISRQNSNDPNGPAVHSSSRNEAPNRVSSSKMKGEHREPVNDRVKGFPGVKEETDNLPRDKFGGEVSHHDAGDMKFSSQENNVEKIDKFQESFSRMEIVGKKKKHDETGFAEENVTVNYDRTASANSMGALDSNTIWAPSIGKNQYGNTHEIGDYVHNTSSHYTVPVFDEYGPEPIDFKEDLLDSFDNKKDDEVFSISPSTTGAKSIFFSEFIHESHTVTEEKVPTSKFDEYKSVTYDDSDGSSPEDEDDVRRSLKNGTSENSRLLHEERDSGRDLGSQEELQPSSSSKSKPLMGSEERDQLQVPSSIGTKGSENAIVGELDLKFGRLTGGLRNRGYNYPPYTASSVVDSSISSKEMVGSTVSSTEQTTPLEKTFTSRPVIPAEDEPESGWKVPTNPESSRAKGSNLEEHIEVSRSNKILTRDKSLEDTSGFGINQFAYTRENNRGYRVGDPNPTKRYPSDLTTTTNAFETTSSEAVDQKIYDEQQRKKGSKNPSSRMSRSDFDSDDDKGERDSPINIGSRGNANDSSTIKLSRRTRGFFTKEKTNFPRSSGYSDTPVPDSENQPLSQAVDEPKILQGNPNLNSWKPNPSAEQTVHEYSAEVNNKIEGSKDPEITTARSGKSKASDSGGGTKLQGVESPRASHVHPKLPDYDTLAAHFQSLRSNRR